MVSVNGRPAGRAPKPTPVIRRTRSWRGVMQVRFNDTRADRNKILQQAFFWSPLRLIGLSIVTTSLVYLYMGHDQFMHSLLGYESEMQYEARVNPSLNTVYGTMLDKDRAWKSPLRNEEKALHPLPDLDVLRDPKTT